jgi:hypothetical protein
MNKIIHIMIMINITNFKEGFGKNFIAKVYIFVKDFQ